MESNTRTAKCRGCEENIPAGEGLPVYWQSGWHYGVKLGYVHRDECIILARSRGVFIIDPRVEGPPK